MKRFDTSKPGTLPATLLTVRSKDPAMTSGAPTEPSTHGTALAMMRDVLAALPAPDLARVLHSAGELTRGDIEKLDRGAWKTFERARLLNRPLPENLLHQLADTVGSSGNIAIYVLQDWWGRRLEKLLLGSAARERARSWRLDTRFYHAMDAFKQDDPVFVSFFNSTLPGLRTSEAVLDRAFAAMADAAIASESLADMGARLLGCIAGPAQDKVELTAGSTTPSTAEEMREPTEALASSGVSAGPPPPLVAPHRALELTEPVDSGNSVDPPPVLSDAQRHAHEEIPVGDLEPRAAPQELPTPLEPSPAAVGELAEMLEQCGRLGQDATALLGRGLFQDLAEVARQAQELKQRIGALYASIQQDLSGHRIELEPIPDAAFADTAVSAAVVAAVKQGLNEVQQIEHQRVAELRSQLARDFTTAGLAPPLALEAARSTADIELMRATWAPRLQEERAYRAVFLGEPEAEAELAKLPAQNRLDQYVRLAADATRPIDPERLLRVFARDAAAATPAPSLAEGLFVQLASLVLEAERPLPYETWELASAIAAGSVAQLLVKNERVLDSLRLVDASLWHPELLLDVVGAERELLPKDVRRPLDRLAIRSLPIEQRIEPLALLALDDLSDRESLGMVLEALLEAGNDRLALLVALTAHRSGALDTLPRSFYDSLLFTVVSCALTGSWRGVASDVVGDGDWLTETVEGATVLLFLAHVLDLPNAYNHLRYARADQLAKASAARPILVGRWLDERLKATPATVDRATVLDRARQALEKWDHEITKTSAYHAWVPAKEYQHVFREQLERAFDVIDAGGQLPDLSAVDLLQEGVSRGIDAAKEPALGEMIRYVSQQIERLAALHEARQLLGAPLREGLRRKEVPLRNELAREAQQPYNARGALALIYNHALGVEQ